MAYIEVNHAEIDSVASAVDSYVQKLRNNMEKISGEITALNSSWVGEDYDQLKKEASEKNAKGSVTEKMLASFTNYADALRDASKQYKEVQSRAINRANALCK